MWLDKIFKKAVSVPSLAMDTEVFILLDDSSVSFCHYPKSKTELKLMSADLLRKAVEYVQANHKKAAVIYPEYPIPSSHAAILSAFQHKKIMSIKQFDTDANVIVFEDWQELSQIPSWLKHRYIWKTTTLELVNNWQRLPFESPVRIDIVVSDIADLTDEDLKQYHTILANMADRMTEVMGQQQQFHTNLLTDRIFLTEMSNCGAGEKHITIAPDGKFYICPAFYDGQMGDIGSLETGIEIKNKQLYSIEFAPICQHCDAYQCKRCVWLNKKLTYEVNTPSHQQCVMAHLERNASRQLLLQVQDAGKLKDKEIPEIHYIDPFDVRYEW